MTIIEPDSFLCRFCGKSFPDTKKRAKHLYRWHRKKMEAGE